MRKSFAALAVAAAATLAISGSVVATGASYWNVTGSYATNVTWNQDPHPGTVYAETLVLVQAGTAITGTSLDYAGGCSRFIITSGSVAGSAITFRATACGVTTTFAGTIAAWGSMAGTWADVAPGTRTGRWVTTSGSAKAITVPSHAKSDLVPYPSGAAVGAVIFNGSSGEPNNLELTVQLKKVTPKTAYDVYLFIDGSAGGHGVLVGSFTTNRAGNGTLHVNTHVARGIHSVAVDVTRHGSGSDVYVTPGLYGPKLYLSFR